LKLVPANAHRVSIEVDNIETLEDKDNRLSENEHVAFEKLELHILKMFPVFEVIRHILVYHPFTLF